MTRRILDSHVHLWRRAATPQPWIDEATMPALARDFEADDLRSVLAAVGGDAVGADAVVTGAVAVQSANSSSETAWLSGVGEPLAAVVGWVDLTSPSVDDRLDALAGAALPVTGIRHLAHEEADPEWLLRSDVARGLECAGERGLAVDLVLHAPQLEVGARVADAHPSTRFVLDHLGNPPLGSDGMEAWRRDLRRVAERPTTVAKLSGLATHADWRGWTPDDLRPALDAALEAFGPDRLMFGSDWPLVDLAGGYRRWTEAYLSWSSALSAEERSAIDAGTAERTYLR